MVVYKKRVREHLRTNHFKKKSYEKIVLYWSNKKNKRLVECVGSTNLI